MKINRATIFATAAAIAAIMLGGCSGGDGKPQPTPTPEFLTALTPQIATSPDPNSAFPDYYLEIDETLYNPTERALTCAPSSFTLIAGGVSHAPLLQLSRCDTDQIAPQSQTTAHLWFAPQEYYAKVATYRLFWNAGFGFGGNGGEERGFTFDSGPDGHGATAN